ncbi:hypothetical protein RRG08_034426 [Elysia crispata]|uniref:Uncharacterized protein n=1 Tax=Elysia crispata TaxID=231223 RepID=A0AAE0YD93_9GAST|nr:hypothetical protein RRG08_034426 [Elysia crispata]
MAWNNYEGFFASKKIEKQNHAEKAELVKHERTVQALEKETGRGRGGRGAFGLFYYRLTLIMIVSTGTSGS